MFANSCYCLVNCSCFFQLLCGVALLPPGLEGIAIVRGQRGNATQYDQAFFSALDKQFVPSSSSISSGKGVTLGNSSIPRGNTSICISAEVLWRVLSALCGGTQPETPNVVRPLPSCFSSHALIVAAGLEFVRFMSSRPFVAGLE